MDPNVWRIPPTGLASIGLRRRIVVPPAVVPNASAAARGVGTHGRAREVTSHNNSCVGSAGHGFESAKCAI